MAQRPKEPPQGAQQNGERIIAIRHDIHSQSYEQIPEVVLNVDRLYIVKFNRGGTGNQITCTSLA